MPEEYLDLAEALKSMTQEETPGESVTLPVAEKEWYTRPDTVSYGVVSLDFEADQLYADDRKMIRSWEGSFDLFSMVKSGAGWVEKVVETLEAHCGGCWSLNSHVYERETGLFHWEWTFEVSD